MAHHAIMLLLLCIASAPSGHLGAAQAVAAPPMTAGDSEVQASGGLWDAEEPCRNAERMCFGDDFSFSIKENESPGVMGVVGRWRLCPQHAVSYNLAKGPSDLFEIRKSPDNSWQLLTKKPLDREEADQWNCTLECRLSSTGEKIKIFSRNITIHVIDEDDSPPIAKIKTHNDSISDPEVKKGQSLNTGLLVVLDADSVGVNNYVIKIDGDNSHGKLFDISLKKYDLSLPKHGRQTNELGSQESDSENTAMHPPSTAIYIEVTFSKNTRLTEDEYLIKLTLIDVTLKGGENGRNQVTIDLTLVVESNERFLQHKAEAHRKLFVEESEVDITSAYPAYVRLPSSAANYSRLAQPPRSSAPLNASLLPPGSPFAVTPARGIFYLRSAAKLRAGSSHLVSIVWGKGGQAAQVNVTVEESAQARCQQVACATRKSAEACAASCGVGAQEWCSWRSAPPTSAPRLSPLYATCTPHPATCPDSVCDELEEMADAICPQDCTREVYGSARRNERDNNGRGIKSATGVCSCDPIGKCSCVSVGGKMAAAAISTTAPAKAGNGGGDMTEKIENKASFDRYHETCGESCFVAVVLGVLAAFSIVLAGGVLARRRRLKAERGGAQAGGVGMALHPWEGRGEGAAPLAMHSQIYGEEEEAVVQQQTELPLLNVHHMQMAAPRETAVGGRWQLPRESLQLEGALGEGEFGLVLRAKLWPTPSVPDCPAPFMTVAVKTLKEGAGDMERAALESEFKLLQSVDHINVVRLIGACTAPGHQSFLMVIEYAELGSLRNYLRKSRLSDVDGAPLRPLPVAQPCQTADLAASTELLSPRHILSFAWQISKGMTYLSEMKLVHRDLAARNVLLTDKGICKISDFGLTRDVYEDDAYYKKSKGRVPVKWLAPESLSDHLYTTHSDVWSFGVLLWELVTLGSSPYPGVPLSGLFSLLHAGYRMQKPANCSPQLYRLMRSCWQLEPGDRPSFQSLMASLEEMLHDQVEYLHLGALFAHNPTYFTSPLDTQGLPLGGEAPYLDKASQPDEQDGEDSHTPAEKAAPSKPSHEAAAADYPWGWTDDGETTPLTAPSSPPPHPPSAEDGYEVPINANTHSLIDSHHVMT
ncbi:proto-oncogene tyrosine-protein kinase receptor Ret [Ischnura elegans]|uniref:proto-oncogene tyrosine-protein kinase receptor Ret n=1 Tax=Ischnura elegans TaxID=197161 RepID=UPI001ED8A68D|nr:proto-oncogene tyrosine-protein kinase receptor Ret [Ischnura elegans]